MYLKELLEGRKRDLLALEYVELFVVAIHEEETIRHHTEQRMFFLRQKEQVLLKVPSALIHDQRQHIIESRRLKVSSLPNNRKEKRPTR